MEYLNAAQAWGIGRGILAIGSGAGAGIAALWGQIPPVVASPQQIDSLTTAIGGGAVAIVIYGAVQILTVVIKPIVTDRTSYWDDKQKQRDYEERKLKLQYQSEERKQKMQSDIRRANWNAKEMYDWMVKAKARNPELPNVPDWIDMHDIEERAER
jgi:disulfide oxidoreductase YuzD